MTDRQESFFHNVVSSRSRFFRRYRKKVEPIIALVLGAVLGTIVLILVR